MKQVFTSFLLIVLTTATAFAVEKFEISIKNHQFEPAELTVPADKKIKLMVTNLDASPEEFESHTLHVEKFILGKGHAVIYIGPLKAGTYKYFGELNQDTAQGTIVAK